MWENGIAPYFRHRILLVKLFLSLHALFSSHRNSNTIIPLFFSSSSLLCSLQCSRATLIILIAYCTNILCLYNTTGPSGIPGPPSKAATGSSPKPNAIHLGAILALVDEEPHILLQIWPHFGYPSSINSSVQGICLCIICIERAYESTVTELDT